MSSILVLVLPQLPAFSRNKDEDWHAVCAFIFLFCGFFIYGGAMETVHLQPEQPNRQSNRNSRPFRRCSNHIGCQRICAISEPWSPSQS